MVIGQIGRPHGVRGSVRARATGPTLPSLAAGEEVRVRVGDAAARRLVLAARAGTDERPILTFEGVGTRDEAAALAGGVISVAAERVAPPADPDTFFVSDLVGCEVLLGDRTAGSVTRVHSAPANDVLEVAGPDGRTVLLPFTADAVREVDLPGRRIVVRPDLLVD